MKNVFVGLAAFGLVGLGLLAGGAGSVLGQDLSQLTNCIPEDPDLKAAIRRVPRAEVQLDEWGDSVYKVNANETWRRTNVEVKRGQRIEISASGTIRWAPDGSAWTFVTADGTRPSHQKQFPYPDAGIGSLVMRIGKSVYPAGTSVVIEAEDEGFVEFMINDDVLGDNSGSFFVKVSIRPLAG